MNILAGDIGGTKTILSVFSSESGYDNALAEFSFPSAKYTSLEDIIREFEAKVNVPFSRACFGVAGPILNGCAHVTNLPWVIDSAAIKSTFRLSAIGLLNDLETLGYAVPILQAKDLFTLNAGIPVKGSGIAVLAPGTGLGEGFLTYEKDHYVALASEGSHASFAPENELQMGLWKFLKQKGYEHISVERVCSGRLGVPLLYEYLKSSNIGSEPAWLKEKIAASDDPTPVIFNAAHDSEHPCALAQATIDLFVAILGAEAGNLALKVMSTAGLYLGGGIPPRILDELKKPAFLKAVRSKGRFEQVLTNMPVHVILNTRASLLGAATYGLSLSD